MSKSAFLNILLGRKDQAHIVRNIFQSERNPFLWAEHLQLFLFFIKNILNMFVQKQSFFVFKSIVRNLDTSGFLLEVSLENATSKD